MFITKSWVAYPVHLPSLQTWLQTTFPGVSDGFISSPESITFSFVQDLTTSEQTTLDNHWNSLTQAGEQAKFNPPANMVQTIQKKIGAAMDFGRTLMAEYGAQNVLAGFSVPQVQQIMQATEALQASLITGSLYVALVDLANIPAPVYDAANGTTVLISSAKVAEFRNKIQTYLGIPLT